MQPNDPVLEITTSILTEAAQRPWLAALLMRRSSRRTSGGWLMRLVQLAQRIRRLPNHTRRVLRRKLASGLAAAALLLALAGTPTAYAGTITVNGTTCTLANAITTANTGTNTGGCTGGSAGPDIISLTVDVGLTAALPNITSVITLEGNNHTISRTSGTLHILNVDFGGNLTLNQATISGGNPVASMGGGIYNGGTLTVNNSTLSGNSADNFGGGIFNGGTLTVNNSTLSGNSAQYGGGILNFGGTLTVQNSTLSGNSATFGGGIYNLATANIQNSIVAGQTSGDDCYNNGGMITSQGYNIESSTTCDFFQPSDQRNVTSGALNLQALANNGTKPHPFTHALGAGSVAINKIPIGTNGCVAGTNTDERGGWRANGAGKGGSACDVGAFEFDSSFTPTAVTLHDLSATSNTLPGDISPSVIGAVGAALAALGAFVIGRRRPRNT